MQDLIILHVLAFVVGLLIVAGTLISAVRTLVLPRSAGDALTRTIFLALHKLFEIRAKRVSTYAERDSIMAIYAPTGLLMLPVVWLILTLTGYMGMYWAFEGGNLWDEFRRSGSALLTLGFAPADDFAAATLSFTEAAIGLALVALLIAYLPTIYAAFSRRETAVTMLEVRAGDPPSAVQLIARFHRLQRLDKLTELWEQWEIWFAEVEESHTSLSALVFFRSPQPSHSWVTAAGAVLDGAAIMASSVDMPRNPQAELCIRAGYLSLRHIADFFNFHYNPSPKPDEPISITRQEFDNALDQLAEQGVPLKPDREQAWRDFRGWRINYDTVLLGMAALTMAPYAPWSSDRGILPARKRPLATHRRGS